MKSDNLIVVAMLGVAAYLVLKGKQAKTGATSATGTLSGALGSLFGGSLGSYNPFDLLKLGTTTYEGRSQSVGSISAADPYSTGGYQGGNGWTYYNDGSAVDPEGELWWQGQKVGGGGTINTYQGNGQVNTDIFPNADIGAVWI